LLAARALISDVVQTAEYSERLPAFLAGRVHMYSNAQINLQHLLAARALISDVVQTAEYSERLPAFLARRVHMYFVNSTRSMC